ncbi:L,D-transpeptidase [Leifsonia shinshuensis]|uniref:L,D-transpeptidase n=1 Tax=Leifsonia shinshuensis TaxID=150026 RepID=UPI001F50DA2A|nr:L,D-transpeptidase [Leifsonia shinshuensis]MCI0156377.1 L,D-transpeptidase [Leifsonia shinshuensis]
MHSATRQRSVIGTLLAACLIGGLTLSGCTAAEPAPTSTTPRTAAPAATSAAEAVPPLPPALGPAAIAALPAAVYNAVIPGLLAAPAELRFTAADTVSADAPLYGADFSTPVARVPARDFLGAPTVVVPVAAKGGWSLVLTASRQVLPSHAPAGTVAPAQTAAWLPTSALRPLNDLPARIVLSLSAQTLTITDASGATLQSFPAGVGAPGTPTPTGTTGYLQARYFDPAQGQTTHRIQLTSLHSTAADEPYGGSDGGLIGVHYEEVASGAVSHGCIRLSAAALAAVDGLPLGTPISIAE